MPGDLNLKKSWNPALIKNQKKLWNEEQKQLEEFKKLKQREKELNEEKEKFEYLKLQYGDDLSNLSKDHKLTLNKMSWMYEGSSDKGKKNDAGFIEKDDEFLLNKKKVENMLNNNSGVELKLDEKSNFNKIIKPTNKKSIISDDPLLKIKSEQRKIAKPRKHKHKSKH
ncbi:hypothetical protein HYPBUDRAFT_231399 [Hyphopichia burtonii NRRL Y-1933]|uniref:Pre-mRNA-splicing factor CWC25 n=1 Tax=Hyphopichia burtonii NRRL Y-1933 TaxID=984485 RepID=A0A1E4RD57_9ASCO|nr:hypothetical protein HYPBUDRAFT_231399 [Hyphopichia burtonii NRRL Y-1933]ODV65204.1 hypothetical protein HYPBUDRAFT_231399 [Hyphopichia burtonii NRRL Y-1933]